MANENSLLHTRFGTVRQQIPVRATEPAHPSASIPGTYAGEAARDPRTQLLDCWRVLVKRRWAILTLVCAVLAVAAIATWKATPIYRASIRLEIAPEQTNLLSFKSTAWAGVVYSLSIEYMNTRIKQLESRLLAARVIRALQLEDNPHFIARGRPTAASRISQSVRSLLSIRKDESSSPASISPEDRMLSDLIQVFRQNSTVTHLKNSRVVEVTFDSPDPKLASDILTTLANEFILLNFETKYAAATTAAEQMSRQLVDLRARVEKSQEALAEFCRANDIYLLGNTGNVTLETLDGLNKELTAAQTDRIRMESSLNVARQAGDGYIGALLRNDLLAALEAKVSTLRQEQARLSALFKPGWPELDKVSEQIEEADRQLSAERERALQYLETKYRTAREREKLLLQAMKAQKSSADSLQQNFIRYHLLKQQANTDKQLYDHLMQWIKEAGVAAGLKTNNIHVADPARLPISPIKPNKPLNMGLALAFGLLLGVGSAFFLEYLDSSVKSPVDVDRYVQLPYLGIIPTLPLAQSATRPRPLIAAGSKAAAQPSESSSVELIAHYNSSCPAAEAYRDLRTSLCLSSGQGHPPRVFLVTSSGKGEGKTTTALNMGITFAKNGERVILLDCDLRNPRIHRVFGLFKTDGMSAYLSGNSELFPLIQRCEVPNLFAIAAGSFPPNPAELVGSPRMKLALELLQQRFDRIVIDSPPVLSVTDARILATVVDGVVLVIRGGNTARHAVLRTRNLLREVHAHLLGVVLNNVDPHSADYYYFSKYRYYGHDPSLATHGAPVSAAL